MENRPLRSRAMEKEISITLPYPPSINRYYRTFRGRILISKPGREYRKAVIELTSDVVWDWEGRVAVKLEVYPPDRRKRDLDNVQKPLLDALQHSGILEDDSLVDDLHTIRGKRMPPDGLVVATISAIEEALTPHSS